MMDEMTAMQEEISKLKAEVAKLKAFVQEVEFFAPTEPAAMYPDWMQASLVDRFKSFGLRASDLLAANVSRDEPPSEPAFKAEVAMLREALTDIKQELEIAPSDSQELQDKSRFTIETLNYCHSIAVTALEDNRFAANVTSEEISSSEPAFKVGDIVIHSKSEWRVKSSDYREKHGMWHYILEATKGRGYASCYEDEMERA